MGEAGESPTAAAAAAVDAPARGLRILFFSENPVAFWRYAPLVAELGRRGHHIHLAFKHTSAELIEQLTAGVPGVTVGTSPQELLADGWGRVRFLVRRLADLARYSDPRYDAAPFLRDRMTKSVLKRMGQKDFDPLGRFVALRLAHRIATTRDRALSTRVVAWSERLERSIPTKDRVDEYIRAQAPDLVLVTPVVKSPDQVEFLKSARKLGIPTAACIRSWDQLTNKGLLKWVPERVFVWNELQRDEAVELHHIPKERVIATGSQVFDEWFERRPSTTREQFTSQVGLDPEKPYLLYLGSTLAITRGKNLEVDFVLGWIDALRSSEDAQLRELGVMVRPHPNPGASAQWDDVDLSHYSNAVIWPRGGNRPVSEHARAEFFDSLTHSAAVVGINTTAMIEAAIVGKSVLTILEPTFAQESTLHFHHLLEQNGGFLHVASTLPEHLDQLSHVLHEDEAGAQRRMAFVQSFIRPHGLDQPATPILADAVEQLATTPADPPAKPNPALRTLLTTEAALTTLALAVDLAVRRVRRWRTG